MKMKVCRLCMRDSYPGMSNIFQPDPHNNTVTTAARIMWVTQLQVCEDDGLSSEICAQCLIQLNAAYFFIEQCMNTDKALRSMNIASQSHDSSPEHFSAPSLAASLPTPSTTTQPSPASQQSSASDGERMEDFESPKSKQEGIAGTVQVKMELADSEDGCENAWQGNGDEQYYYGNTNIKSEPVKSWEDSNGSGAPVSFTCSICDGSFKNKQSYISHIRLHTSEQMQFECGECKKTFNCQSHLNRHLRSHSGENPYKCPVCAKAFYRQDHLTKHFRCHTGERPYHCSTCPRSFARQDHLSNHMKLHTKPRPFQCSLCDKSFFKESGLVKHSKGHPMGMVVAEQPPSCGTANIVANYQVTEN